MGQKKSPASEPGIVNACVVSGKRYRQTTQIELGECA